MPSRFCRAELPCLDAKALTAGSSWEPVSESTAGKKSPASFPRTGAGSGRPGSCTRPAGRHHAAGSLPISPPRTRIVGTRPRASPSIGGNPRSESGTTRPLASAKLRLEGARHQLLRRHARILFLVEDAVDLLGDRHLHAELLGHLPGGTSRLDALGHMAQRGEDVAELAPAAEFDA